MDPIPLIPWHQQAELPNLKLYGYLLLFALWAIFIITINSIFQLWRYIIDPHQSPVLTSWMNTFDEYVFRSWSFYVVIWWWAIIAWCGIKLFRHSKGN